jgi:hypothetical protein
MRNAAEEIPLDRLILPDPRPRRRALWFLLGMLLPFAYAAMVGGAWRPRRATWVAPLPSSGPLATLASGRLVGRVVPGSLRLGPEPCAIHFSLDVDGVVVPAHGGTCAAFRMTPADGDIADVIGSFDEGGFTIRDVLTVRKP